MRTIRESVTALENGENVVIFPEVSDKGYLEVLEGFHPGFVSLCEVCKKKGIDVPIYVTYFRKKDLTYIVDKPVYYSQLSSNGETKQEIAQKMVERCNALGQMQFGVTKGMAELFIEEQSEAVSQEVAVMEN